MKSVIGGKLYDTETAEEISSDSSGHTRDDFHYEEESLYRTKKGNWFLLYRGGAMSRYGQSFGNECHGSSGIKVLTEDEVFEWLQEHDRADIILELFMSRVEEA